MTRKNLLRKALSGLLILTLADVIRGKKKRRKNARLSR